MSLPSTYQEVEYIESTGTQYINTGIIPTADKARIVSKSVATVLGSDYYTYRLAGAYDGDNLSPTLYYCTSPIRVGAGGTDAATSITYSVNTTLIADVIFDNQTITGTFNGGSFSHTYWDTIVVTTPIYLFCYNYKGTANSYCSAKLYSFSYWDNDILIRDFVPCYRKSDNVIGLYDTVNNVFYENAGTGTFLKGSDVANPKVTKLEFNGVLYDLGSSNHTYSTDEQVVGTWIDGRSVYQKTFTGTTSSSADVIDVTDSTLIIDIKGVLENSDNNGVCIATYINNDDAYASPYIHTNNTKVTLYTSSNFTGSTYYITICYLKESAS